MTVRREKESRTPKVFIHKIADVRGGVAVKASDLGGDYLREGAVLGAPQNGLCPVLKTGVVYASYAANGTKLKLKKYHNFKVGDVLTKDAGSKAVAITAIDASNKDYDELTIAALGYALAAGDPVVQAQAAGDEAALKVAPFAIVGTGKTFNPGDNLDTDAWVIGVTKGNPLPASVNAALKGIVNY